MIKVHAQVTCDRHSTPLKQDFLARLAIDVSSGSGGITVKLAVEDLPEGWLALKRNRSYQSYDNDEYVEHLCPACVAANDEENRRQFSPPPGKPSGKKRKKS